MGYPARRILTQREVEREEMVERGVEGSPDGLHHPRVPQLPRAQLSVKHERCLFLVWLHTPHEERLALTQSRHQGIQRSLELQTESGRLPAGLRRLRGEEGEG